MNKDVHGRIISDCTKNKWISYIKKKYKDDVYYKKIQPRYRIGIDAVAISLSKELGTSNYNIENAYLYLKTLIDKLYLEKEKDILDRYKNKIEKTFKVLKELLND